MDSNRLVKLMHRMLADDTGSEALEYALVIGLIISTAMVPISQVGPKVLARWSSLNSSLSSGAASPSGASSPVGVSPAMQKAIAAP